MSSKLELRSQSRHRSTLALARAGLHQVPKAIQLLRRTLREKVPFEVRVGIRRVPHVARWLFRDTTARIADGSVFPHLHAERSSPLRRPGAEYDELTQRAKETNVMRAVRALNGVVIAPDETFSWHNTLGPPLALRGFACGPELHDGKLDRGTGGGVCQVANLVFWLAAMGGMQIVERHRHGLDLFPDANRDLPFGCGATVFYPHRDLKFHNGTRMPIRLGFRLVDNRLHGQLQFQTDPGFECALVELGHRFFERGGARYRENRLERVTRYVDGTTVRDLLVENQARVCY